MLAQLVTFQRLTLLGRLSPIVSHEVNNQLTGVSGYAQLLLGQEQARPLEKELDKIHSSAMRCQKLIGDMRRIGRFADSEREFDNINFIIQFSLDLFRHQFTKRSFQVSENYSSDISSIEVNTPALEQTFLNIIQNSFEALEEKGGNFSVTTLKEDGQLVALFEDDGPGLSEDAFAHLFTPFFTTKRHLHCPGLGLTAAKSIVEAHKGTIQVTNSPAGGACVRVSLPCETDTK
jgi:C4-dicarboxylate-specific signal transduction histidine kinase